jgi:LytS/YehU family sensor histidine kinase
VVISFLFWFTLANGNSYLVDLLDKKWSWLEQPTQRAIYGILAMFAFSVADSLIIIYLWVEFYLKLSFVEVVESDGFIGLIIVPLIITAIIALWGHGKGFLMAWRQSAVDIEKLRAENIQSRLESLRNQVNPHFLFNSLNTLSSLVHEDQDKATEFINELSQVYRYILDHQSDELVDLETELLFLRSFLHLNEIRFGDKLQTKIHGDQELSGFCIPPVTLQLLTENVIKHNEISSDHKVNLDIAISKDTISIRNNRNPKAKKDDSLGLGLQNIHSRYKLLTNKEVIVNEHEDTFEVILPQLKLT